MWLRYGCATTRGSVRRSRPRPTPAPISYGARARISNRQGTEPFCIRLRIRGRPGEPPGASEVYADAAGLKIGGSWRSTTMARNLRPRNHMLRGRLWRRRRASPGGAGRGFQSIAALQPRYDDNRGPGASISRWKRNDVNHCGRMRRGGLDPREALEVGVEPTIFLAPARPESARTPRPTNGRR